MEPPVLFHLLGISRGTLHRHEDKAAKGKAVVPDDHDPRDLSRTTVNHYKMYRFRTGTIQRTLVLAIVVKHYDLWVPETRWPSHTMLDNHN